LHRQSGRIANWSPDEVRVSSGRRRRGGRSGRGIGINVIGIIVDDSAGAQSGKYKHRAAVPKVSALVPEILILAPPLDKLRGIQATGHQEHLLQVILLAILTHIQVHIEATRFGNLLVLLLWLREIEGPKQIPQVQRDNLSRCRPGQERDLR